MGSWKAFLHQIDLLNLQQVVMAWICHSYYSPLLRGEGMDRRIMSRVNCTPLYHFLNVEQLFQLLLIDMTPF